jgi:acylphosphatase
MVQTEEWVRKHLLIEGRVQGVGYRYSMQRQGAALGLRGWCRNLPDGRVEADVIGPPHSVEQLITWCHDGPPHAMVSDVIVVDTPVDNTTLPEPFTIRT